MPTFILPLSIPRFSNHTPPTTNPGISPPPGHPEFPSSPNSIRHCDLSPRGFGNHLIYQSTILSSRHPVGSCPKESSPKKKLFTFVIFTTSHDIFTITK